eukprot:gene12880-27164_t
MRILSEEAIAHIHPIEVEIETPTASSYNGCIIDESSIVVISIIRAGDSMLEAFLECLPNVSVGKILIQRNEETAEPVFYYKKLPSLENKNVILLDPMLATGGSVIKAIEVCIQDKADIRNITFVNVVSCPEGLENIFKTYP